MLMIFIAVTAFIFGVKMGKEYAFRDEGFTKKDRQTVELMSGQEEDLEKVMLESKRSKRKDEIVSVDSTYRKLKEEFNRLSKHESIAVRNRVAKGLEYKVPKKRADDFKGKHTVQLGSYRKLEDAEEFGNGFRVRGYNPIINEVAIKGRTWYRISLGVFETPAAAKKYIVKEKTLFQGQDYRIVQFD